MLASKSSSAVIVILTTYDRQGTMERKTRYEVQELLVAEYETDGSMKFITAQNFGIVTKLKERYVLKLEFDEGYKKHFTKFVQEFDELEVEGFLRERFTEMQATELVIKNKQFIDNSRQMYQKGSF